MIILKKRQLADNSEYLNATDLIDEKNLESTEKIYPIGKACADVLNYYQENTPDAYGNAPYARLDGFLQGYLAASKLELIKSQQYWDIVKNKRVLLRIEVPKKPSSHYETISDMNNALEQENR